MISYQRIWMNFCKRELLIHARQLRLVIHASLFFFMMMVFFPLTLPADTNLLRTILPGLVWMALLLAMILSAERLFQQDYDDGVIEQWLVSGLPLSLLVLAKLCMHWLISMLPILLFCPILALLYSLSVAEMVALMLSLICGTPALLALCALATVFSTSLQQKGVFMALIILPLTIPVMIFGSAALTASMNGLGLSGYLALLLAISVLALGFLPFAIAAMIRISLVD